MQTADNYTTLKELSSEYAIDTQRIRRFVKQYHMDMIVIGCNNQWLISPELKQIILERFKLGDGSGDGRIIKQMISQLNSQLAEKDKQISELHRLLETKEKSLQNQQQLSLDLQRKLDALLLNAPDEPDAVVVEPEIVKPEKEPVIEVEDDKPRRGLFGRFVFGKSHK